MIIRQLSPVFTGIFINRKLTPEKGKKNVLFKAKGSFRLRGAGCWVLGAPPPPEASVDKVGAGGSNVE